VSVLAFAVVSVLTFVFVGLVNDTDFGGESSVGESGLPIISIKV